MSRYLIIAMGVLAMSACTDNRPHDRNSQNSNSNAPGKMNDTRNDSSSTQNGNNSNARTNTKTATNAPGRSSQTSVSGMNDSGSDTSQSTNRTGLNQTSTGRSGQTNSTLTAGDQSESEADRTITQQIRKAVVADSSLSVKAQNCTIVTIGGVVTLRGSVDTAAERQSIASKVDGISGVRRLDNYLKIEQ